MSITFKGKNIKDLYKSGTISVIPNILSTEKVPTNEFEKNYANGIKINGKDINELANSPYVDYTSGNNLYTNNVGYKHISVYGATKTGAKGANGWTCDSKHNGGSGGAGGDAVKFGILKYPINGSNTNTTFNGTSISINIGNTNLLTANSGGTGGKGNDATKRLIALGPAKECANDGSTGSKGANGTYTSNTSISTPLPAGENRENFVRIYFHYQ